MEGVIPESSKDPFSLTAADDQLFKDLNKSDNEDEGEHEGPLNEEKEEKEAAPIPKAHQPHMQ